MQDYYGTYGLIKKGKCMYCLKGLNEQDEEETADHFGVWCKVMPGYLMHRGNMWKNKLLLGGLGKRERDLNLHRC